MVPSFSSKAFRWRSFKKIYANITYLHLWLHIIKSGKLYFMTEVKALCATITKRKFLEKSPCTSHTLFNKPNDVTNSLTPGIKKFSEGFVVFFFSSPLLIKKRLTYHSCLPRFFDIMRCNNNCPISIFCNFDQMVPDALP